MSGASHPSVHLISIHAVFDFTVYQIPLIKLPSSNTTGLMATTSSR